MKTEIKLLIFDFDGVLVEWSKEYRKWYSSTLERVVERERGKKGLEIVEYCRKAFNGKGELALFLLDIPFRKWAQLLIKIPRDIISSQPEIVSRVKKIPAYKVIYTGSPTKMVERVLPWLGFSLGDFHWILGWRKPELFPLKWTSSPLVFEAILSKFSVAPKEAWVVGDDWTTDLQPAKAIGLRTVGIGKCEGKPDFKFKNVKKFLEFIGGEREWKEFLM